MNLTLLGVVTLFFATTSSATSVAANIPSPSAEVELICHTDNAAECYPRLFQATDKFQTVHDDQDLPPGLHVRLNLATGLKEAKINDPNESDPALEGLLVEASSVVIFDDGGGGDEGEDAGGPRIPADAPVYDPVGKIKPPAAGDDDGVAAEASDFYRTLTVLHKGLDVDGALEMLEEIAHDIYYGLKIAEDYGAVRRLFCLASAAGRGDAKDVTAETMRRARLAALTIASALQNNPKALAQLENHWPVLRHARCGKDRRDKEEEDLTAATFRLVSSSSSSSAVSDTGADDPALTKARVAALDGLLKSAAIRRDFLARGGMERVLEVLMRSSGGGDGSGSGSGSKGKDKGRNTDADEWEPAARKAGLLVLDNFLDENMGAALGEWPTAQQLTDGACEKAAAAADPADAGCWAWWARRIAHRHRGERGHWSGELWGKLQEQSKANAKRTGPGRSEL